MKRFLRTTTIFACLVLMLSACNKVDEEEVVDLNIIPVVGTSSIMDLRPGKNKFYVEWSVNDSEYINSCTLSWSSGSSISGSVLFENVTPGETMTFNSEEYFIAVADTTGVMDSLAAGVYSIAITNGSDEEIYTMPEARSLTIYSDETYEESDTLSATDIIYDGANATIYWGDTPDECAGVIATYAVLATSSLVDPEDLDITADTMWITTDLLTSSGSVVLPEALANTDVYFTSCFQPALAIADDYYEFLDTLTIPGISPAAPTNVSARPGDFEIEVTWTITSFTEPVDWDHTVFEVADTSGAIVYTYEYGLYNMYGEEQVQLGPNTTTVPNFKTEIGSNSAGTYSVTVRNSSADGAYSLGETVTDLSVYDYTSYSSYCQYSIPILSVYLNTSTNVYVASFSETGSIKCTEVAFTYQYQGLTTAAQFATRYITDFSEPLYISNGVAGSVYSYTATFSMGENAMHNDIVLSGEGGTLPTN